MAKVQLDIDKFMELMRGALVASAVTEPEPPKVKAKPGRKPKLKMVVDDPIMTPNNFLDEEEDETPLPPPKKNNNGIHTAREKPLNISDDKTVAGKMEFQKKKPGEVAFYDPGTSKNITTPYYERTERRDPVQMQKFRCDACGRTIEAYASEYPQARPIRLEGREEFRPILKCNDCAGVPGNVGYIN